MDLSTPLVKQCSKTPKVTFKESSSSSPHEPISTLARHDLFSCLLPLCYRNTPAQAHPARCRLLRFLVFLLRYMLLGLLSLGNRASLNQRAVGSTFLESFRFGISKLPRLSHQSGSP